MHELGAPAVRRFAACRPSPRRARLTLALAAVTLLAALGASVVLAAPAFPTHTCGYFFKRGQDVIVYNGGSISCTKATKLIKDFWSGKGATQHGTSDAGSYWTIKGFPGYRCIQSMGQGDCWKGSAIAGYMVKA